MQTLLKDIRYGIRTLLRRPSFSAIAIITLALGIGATTTIFSVVDALLLKELSYPNAEQLVVVREVGTKGNQMAMAGANFEDVQASNQSFSTVAIVAGSFQLAATVAGEPVRSRISMTSRSFFDVMGVQPLVGRTFQPEEEKFGGPVAALLSYGYWQRTLGGRADFAAVKLNVDGVACNVVGVMPPDFDYPASAGSQARWL